MAWGDRFYRQATEKVQAKSGEPVELITRAGRPGAMGALVGGEVLRGIDVAGGSTIGVGGAAAPGGRMIAAGGGKGARLPLNFLVALTPTALRVFTVRPGWIRVKVRKELGVIPRDGLQLAMADGGLVKRFRLDATDGSGIAFEMTKCKFTTSFAENLRAALGA
jgi:hypothetical protein